MDATNVVLGLALAFVLAAAAFDMRTGHIPNGLTYAGLVLGGLLQLYVMCVAQRSPDAPLTLSLFGMALARVAAGVLVCGLVPFVLFLKQGMGGGDVKLLAALGAALGPVVGLEVQLYAFVAVALFAPARLAYEGRLFAVLNNAFALLTNPMRAQARRRPVAPELLSWLRFGPAVLVAMALVTVLRWRAA